MGLLLGGLPLSMGRSSWMSICGLNPGDLKLCGRFFFRRLLAWEAGRASYLCLLHQGAHAIYGLVWWLSADRRRFPEHQGGQAILRAFMQEKPST